MNLGPEHFDAFYAEVNGGHQPFAWQRRLLDHLLDEGRWPEQIAAPTGAGKTSAIDVHVFATAVTNPSAVTSPSGGHSRSWPRLPRRLAMVVDRRVLVDDQHDRAATLAQHLAQVLSSGSARELGGAPSEPASVTLEVAQRLAALRWPADRPREAGADPADPRSWPLVVARLRGGVVPSRWWRDEITACSVVCATPDMWGSRALFRGYGTTGKAAPREAGALAIDAAVLVDEAHLAQQLLTTARRVAELAAVAERSLGSVPTLQVVETTATPTGGVSNGVGVQESDLYGDGGRPSVLAPRLQRPKPVRLIRSAHWPAARSKAGKPSAEGAKLAVLIADSVVSLRDETAGGASRGGATQTLGCFVNSVPMAVQVSHRLRGDGMRVVMVCGQTRQADLDRLREARPGVFTPAGNDEVDVIVSTQSLEAGVDLDLAGVVTELASGSALAQRAGRVNRRGLRAMAPVWVIGPSTDSLPPDTMSGPYEALELAATLRWILRREQDPAGLAPWAVRSDPAPAQRRRRTLYQRPELADAWHWARTSDALAAEPELDLWLSDSFDTETSVGIVVRDALPDDAGEAVELIRRLPPREHEIFPAPRRTVLAALSGEQGHTVLRIRGEEIAPARRDADGTLIGIRPGDLLVIDSQVEVFSPAGPEGVSPQVVVDAPIERKGSTDVLAHRRAPVRAGQVVLRLDLTGSQAIGGIDWSTAKDAAAEVIEELTDAEQQVREGGRATSSVEAARRAAVVRLLNALLATTGAVVPDARAMVEAAISLLGGRVKDSDVMVDVDAEGRVCRVVLVDRRRIASDDDVRQVFTPRDGVVTLDRHQSAVASRAEVIAESVGLPADVGRTLHQAGAHHDDGKADQRFQARLGAESEPLLAKSDPRSTLTQLRERERRAGLPTGWRHEQLSVLLCWSALPGAGGEQPPRSSPERDGPEADPALVARLVGTSHGYGRSSFPHAGALLLPEEGRGSAIGRLAAELFDCGGWDDLIEQTQQRYGVWGCAYLEAVLRAADGQVSGEGS